MNERNDIINHEDIRLLVNSFYDKVREDEILSPVFAARIPADAWPKHLQIMYNFWASVLFAENAYHGSPFPKHLNLGIESFHFDKWIELFHKTIDFYFAGPKADEAKVKSGKIRLLFESKLNLTDAGKPGLPIVKH